MKKRVKKKDSFFVSFPIENAAQLLIFLEIILQKKNEECSNEQASAII